MALRVAKTFATKLTDSDFIRYLKLVGNEASCSPESVEARAHVENLFANFKKFHSDYCKQQTCVVTTVHWAHLLKIRDAELWDLLKIESMKHLCALDSKSLALLMQGLAERVDEEARQDLIQHAKDKANILDQRCLVTIGKALKVDLLGDTAPKTFVNPIRFLYYLQTLSPGYEVESRCDELSETFAGFISSMTNAQCFCNILNEFNRLRLIPPKPILLEIEEKAANPNFKFNGKDYNFLLKAFNHDTFHGKISMNFFTQMEKKLAKDILNIPSHQLLLALVKNGFDSEPLLTKVISLWRAQIQATKNASNFREGFYYAVQTDYLSEELLQWCFQTMKEMLPHMKQNDYVLCLRALTVKEMYDPELMDLLTQNIIREIDNLNSITQSVLFVTLKSLKIDQPPNANELIARFDPYITTLKTAFTKNSIVSKSDSQRQLSEVLFFLGYKFKEGVILEDIYEADCIFPDKKLIVEMMGWPYHTNQYGGRIRATTNMKLRHLIKLGWNVISVFSWKSLSTKLPALIDSIDPNAPAQLLFMDSSN